MRLAVLPGRLDITPEQVAASPYAQIRVDGPDGGALMVLGNDDDGLQSWFAPDGRIVFMRGGLLAGTSGFGEDALDLRIVGDDPFARLATLQAPATTLRRADWMPGYRHGVELHGELRRGPIETVRILDRTLQLQRFDEELRGPGVDTTNVYWAEPDTGFVRKSRQLASPGITLEIEQLKPYRGTAR